MNRKPEVFPSWFSQRGMSLTVSLHVNEINKAALVLSLSKQYSVHVSTNECQTYRWIQSVPTYTPVPTPRYFYRYTLWRSIPGMHYAHICASRHQPICFWPCFPSLGPAACEDALCGSAVLFTRMALRLMGSVLYWVRTCIPGIL